jgi:hypothetical protein
MTLVNSQLLLYNTPSGFRTQGIIRRKSLSYKVLYRPAHAFFLNGPVAGDTHTTGRERAAAMNEQRIAEELLALLEGHGVKIRHEPLGGCGGGLAVVKGENIFFVDTEAASAEVATLCAEAVARLLDIETIYLKPDVRCFIEQNTYPGM